MNDTDLKILNDFNKAIKMGEDSYAMLIEKTDDSDFKELLQKQSKKYEDFLMENKKLYNNIDKEPKDTPVMQKMMGWTGVQMNIMKDSSNSHIAEMLIQGAIMGYIECNKLLNSNPNMQKELNDRIISFSNLQLEIIKENTKFLKK